MNDLENLKRRSALLYSLPEERTEVWIEAARQVSLEAEADFWAEVEQSYLLLIDILREELGGIEVAADLEKLLRGTMVQICARQDEPSEEINLLAEKILHSISK